MSDMTVVRVLAVCVLLITTCAGVDAVLLLNGQWTVRNVNGSVEVPGHVPGGIYSDLRQANIIDDILYQNNDVRTRWVAHDSWVYEGKFTVTKQNLNFDVINLVLYGVDTVAYIELNDSPIGRTNNMFVRYVFDVKEHIKEGVNILKIAFESPIVAANARSKKFYTPPNCVPEEYNGECHANQLRKMQASFGWDWGPAFPSVGLWKPVQLEFYNSVIIRSVTTHITSTADVWNINIKTYLETKPGTRSWSGQMRADLKVYDNVITVAQNKKKDSINSDGTFDIEFNVQIKKDGGIKLWWPNGYGSQNLYELTVSARTDNSPELYSKTIKIGFRTVELVQEPAAKIIHGGSASLGLTFYFKVNGVPIFMKGSNWIPADILPERTSEKQQVNELLLAARSAHMNMLRVWGGGVYESNYFYQRCDELGILIWQDFLFACSMYPVDTEFLSSVRQEIEQNVKRLQHHPSIALWAGNNENEVALRGDWYQTASNFDIYKQDYIKLYVNTISPIVSELDPLRPYVVSSPSNGLESEKEGYIAQNPYDSHYGDTHYYNYFADNWNPNTYPKTRFASEYGFQSMPSLATMRTATTYSLDFSIESEYSKHRQHSPGGYGYIQNQMEKHFVLPDQANMSDYFEKFVFYSQISQAMSMKAETEFYRQSQYDWYTMGALYWQLNDVWQAPSWSGIEYGGKWKMLHYFAKRFFAPVLISPKLLLVDSVEVYLINDRMVPIDNATIKVDVFNWSSVVPIKSALYPGFVNAVSSNKQNVNLDMWTEDRSETFLRFSLNAPTESSSPYNYIFPKAFKTIRGLKRPNIQIRVRKASGGVATAGYAYTYLVDITVDTVVLFLWLEVDSIEGRFEDNAFIVTQPNLLVRYVSNTDMTAKTLQKSITYNYYLS